MPVKTNNVITNSRDGNDENQLKGNSLTTENKKKAFKQGAMDNTVKISDPGKSAPAAGKEQPSFRAHKK